jgi:hypothetical protein
VVQKIPAKQTSQSVKAGSVKTVKKAKKKTADEVMLEAWETTYTNHQKEIEKANKLLLLGWQKTYENRGRRLD